MLITWSLLGVNKLSELWPAMLESLGSSMFRLVSFPDSPTLECKHGDHKSGEYLFSCEHDTFMIAMLEFWSG